MHGRDVCNGDGLGGGSAGGADLLDGLDNIKTLDDLSEDDVLAVQPSRRFVSTRRRSDTVQSTYEVLTVQMKNWDPLVPGPALAMERIPGPVCLRLKFSSSNFSP
ncbi:hypothetical protein IAQ61_002389 [Plenodomus lingam]|uniref:uncharacterized protein n=1 Tax=Leptosphaeria maculans TaxID=5022 RepID=UPI0033340A8E|nr:hypothetical protein IAQ61_002389 [Plenodomus lingam]